jgi:ABC-type polysaccharide/polyol phosphate export permease
MNQLIIEARCTERNYQRDRCLYGVLTHFFAGRDLHLPFELTIIGAAWLKILPLLTIWISPTVFGNIFSDNAHRTN